ncbi:hypothetical protein Tco_1578681 [Tanacetum coccineum]
MVGRVVRGRGRLGCIVVSWLKLALFKRPTEPSSRLKGFQLAIDDVTVEILYMAQAEVFATHIRNNTWTLSFKLRAATRCNQGHKDQCVMRDVVASTSRTRGARYNDSSSSSTPLKGTHSQPLLQEAIEVLEEAGSKGHAFEKKVEWGIDLASKHESLPCLLRKVKLCIKWFQKALEDLAVEMDAMKKKEEESQATILSLQATLANAECHTPSAAETRECNTMIHIAQDTRSYHTLFTKVYNFATLEKVKQLSFNKLLMYSSLVPNTSHLPLSNHT